MLYQLPDGRTIEISMHEFLSLDDEGIKQLIGVNYGLEINNPRYGSSINKPYTPKSDSYSEHEIPDVPEEEKFDDQDYTQDE
jgi:hypothetical protein